MDKSDATSKQGTEVTAIDRLYDNSVKLIQFARNVAVKQVNTVQLSGWNVRTLQRQYNSSLYEHLALSRNKDAVLQPASEGNVVTKPEDIVKQPTVLEFLGMEEKAEYVESDLESAIIDKLQKFLLEIREVYYL